VQEVLLVKRLQKKRYKHIKGTRIRKTKLAIFTGSELRNFGVAKNTSSNCVKD